MALRGEVKPYELIQVKTGELLFAAAYVKYYPQTQFAALLQEYPAERTKIWVCRKVDTQKTDFGYRLAKLVSHSAGREKLIGNYVKVFEADTEKEVEDRLIANMVGTMAVRAGIFEE